MEHLNYNKGQKHCQRHRLEMTRVKQCILDMTGPCTHEVAAAMIAYTD